MAVDANADAAVDGAGTDALTDDAGFTQCLAPDGVQVCGVPACPDDVTCEGCLSSNGLSVCAGKDPSRFHVPCQPCLDGDVCFQVYPTDPATWISGPYSTGVLFAKNGAPD